jgi:hypothetical protein
MEKKVKKTEDINKYMVNYRQMNKDKINQSIQCEICGVQYMKVNKSHHIKSNKHKQMEAQILTYNKIQELENKIETIKNVIII